MTVEHGGEYIKHFRSEHIPRDLTWQRMLETGETIAPRTLAYILAEAKHDLLTTPGPNLDRRRKLVPDWFNYWISLCGTEQNNKRKLFPFAQINDEVQSEGPRLSGLLMLAGGEGHRGHRQAASIMSSRVSRVVFAFEEPETLEQTKHRGEFLPLVVRLSMWNMHNDVHLLTVLPPKPNDAETNDHYEHLFVSTGATMQFVEVQDPFVRLKQARRTSNVRFGENIYVSDFYWRTTDHVERLMPDIEMEDMLTMSIHESIAKI